MVCDGTKDRGHKGVFGRGLRSRKVESFRVHVDGQMNLMLPCPRIAVFGMRNLSSDGLDRAGRMIR